MKKGLFLLALAVTLASCSGGASDESAARPDSLTQRQRDSIIGASRLPGAGGVRGALEASDAASARAAALDSAAARPR